MSSVLILLLVVVIAFVPWLAFWAIGVLFGHHIDVTGTTWLAAWVLVAIVGGSSSAGGHRG